MNSFEYANPTTLREAVELLGSEWGQTEVLAGGTDLLTLMKEYVSTPDRLVNIKSISGLNQIHSSGGNSVRIGALVTLQELVDDEHLGHWFPSLKQAANGVTSPQIRAMGTVGGDLLQRPRCWYYRAGFGLLATGPDGGSLVPRGDNRYHAVFGGGPAYFVNASSLAPSLIALGASVKLVGPDGNRTVALEDFFAAPNSPHERENVLRSNEILTEIVIANAGLSNASYEVRQREVLDWPLATASVALKLHGKEISDANVVLGHVAPAPRRAKAAEQVLIGKIIGEAAAMSAGKAATEGASPLSNNGYKIRLVQTAVKRAVVDLASA